MATECEPIVCPETCNEALPIPKHRRCNPEFHFGNFSDIYATNVGYPLEDETDATEWNTRLNLPANDPSKIIHLVVSGEMPDAEVPEVPASKGRTAYGIPKRTVQGVVDEVTQDNYELMRKIRCGKTILFWPKTLGGKAFGGPAGIEASWKMGHVVPLSAQELENLPFNLKWEKLEDPCRFDHPLQGDDSDLDS